MPRALNVSLEWKSALDTYWNASWDELLEPSRDAAMRTAAALSALEAIEAREAAEERRERHIQQQQRLDQAAL